MYVRNSIRSALSPGWTQSNLHVGKPLLSPRPSLTCETRGIPCLSALRTFWVLYLSASSVHRTNETRLWMMADTCTSYTTRLRRVDNLDENGRKSCGPFAGKLYGQSDGTMIHTDIHEQREA